MEGAFGLKVPLAQDLEFSDISIRGRATLNDPQATGLAGDYVVTGGELVFDVNDKALHGEGDVLVRGVPVNVEWHRIFGASDDLQPGLRLRATLDEKDRSDLGLDINHIVRGTVPLALTVTQRSGERRVRVEADLSGAELFFINVASRKPPGPKARF